MSRTLPAALAVLALSALLFLVACEDEDGDGPPPTATETAPATAVVSPTAPALATGTPEPVPTGAFEGGREPLEWQTGEQGTAYIVDVRTGRHDEGFDRVTFEFENHLPSIRVEYVDPPIIADPSGLPVEVDGSAFLKITLSPASGVDLSGATPRTTCCRSQVTTGLPALLDVERTGDFEAVTTYVLGLSAEVDFRVIRLPGPPRFAIDVQHP